MSTKYKLSGLLLLCMKDFGSRVTAFIAGRLKWVRWELHLGRAHKMSASLRTVKLSFPLSVSNQYIIYYWNCLEVSSKSMDEWMDKWYIALATFSTLRESASMWKWIVRASTSWWHFSCYPITFRPQLLNSTLICHSTTLTKTSLVEQYWHHWFFNQQTFTPTIFYFNDHQFTIPSN